ncbi:MAG: site-2 protease family protein, partial [Planctomycetes bacterium]|nr:site-2 protease family protein [Planctomycetota bacterium]
LALQKEYRGTVYGIGILPLGGYCALAGQNDDPRKERRTGALDELQAKPIWARLLVFSGGVLMNFAFGFMVLVAAFMYGIPFIPPVLGSLDPSGPAAVYGFEPGDRILRINELPVGSFEEASEAIALSGSGSEMAVEIERPGTDGGEASILTIRVKGRASGGRGNLNSIGAEPLRSRTVAGIVEDPLFSDLLAGKLGIGDEILAVDGKEIPPNQGQLIQALAGHRPGQDLPLSVKSAANGQIREVRVPLETYGEWDMGLRVGVGIASVMPDGPAAKAGLAPGDLVTAYQLQGDQEPSRLASTRQFMELVADAALKPVTLGVRRGDDHFDIQVQPQLAPVDQEVDFAHDTLLGVEGDMEGEGAFLVKHLPPDSPSAGKLRPGDFITGINGRPLSRGKSLREAIEDASSHSIRLFVSRQAEDHEIVLPKRRDIPDANLSLRLSPRINPQYRRPMIGVDLFAGPVVAVEPGSFADTTLGGIRRLRGSRLIALGYSPDLGTIILRFSFPSDSPFGAGLKTLVVETPEEVRDNPRAYGLMSRLPISLKTAEEVKPLSLAPALAAAGKKWVDLSLMVYSVIHKLVVRTLPLDAVGGPVQLFRIIKIADDRGFAYFLYIVALISVNLGVCNLLPFPVLDGGHLVFLLIEWLLGRPPPQLLKDTAQWIGLVCLLTLMLTVTGYDLLHLFRGTG